jgi:NADH-quinone oxidoreductase subunit M
VFVVAGLASMGLPGFSGFPAELTILIGAWKVSPAWAAVAALGVLVAAAFTLRAIQVAFFGRTAALPESAAAAHPLPPITLAEKAGALLLVAATLIIGLKPDLLLNWIIPSLQSPLFSAALKGGAP